MPVSTSRACPDCGAPISGSTLAGLCPVCLFQGGLTEAEQAGLDTPVGMDEYAGGLPGVRRFAKFELLGEIARGGMGVVYRARQDGLRRIVAVKLIVGGPWAGKVLRERFVLEARTAASLTHPHIVQVYDFGEHAGHAYLSMHFAENGSLADALAAGRWPKSGGVRFRRTAEFMRDVAGAVHHAHQRGVLHRDLKPSNILLDEAGRPLVADFGLAKLRDVGSSLTHSSAVLGTPAYMAPEQAAGKTAEVTTAADIYSLGAILYELLTGRPPFVGETPLQTIQQIARYELVPPDRLNTEVPRDLMIICLKCLRWEPGDRYASAAELEEDLQRWLNREPIHARSITAIERLGYWVRRRPLVAGLSALLALLLGVTAFGGTWQALRLQHAHRAVRQSADESRQRLARVYLQQWEKLLGAGQTLRSLPLLVEGMELAGDDGRAQALHRRRLESVLTRSPALEQMWFLRTPVERVDVSPDGRRIAAGGYGGEVRVWDSATGAAAFPAIQHADYLPAADAGDRAFLYLWNVRFSPDGDALLTACNNDAFLWDAASGHRLGGPFRHPKKVWQTAFTPDGAYFVTACLDGRARVYSIDGGQVVFETEPQAAGLVALAVSADGRWLATGCRAGTIRWWNLADRREMRVPPSHQSEIRELWFDPGATRLASASRDGVARVWNLQSGEAIELPHPGTVNSIAFSPDGATLATASTDGSFHLWRLADGRLMASDRQQRKPLNKVVFAPDGKRVLAAGDEGDVRAWRVADGQAEPWSIPHNQHLNDLAFLPDGRRLVSASTDGVIRLSRLPEMAAVPEPVANPELIGPDWQVIARNGRMAFYRQGELLAEHPVLAAGLDRAIPSVDGSRLYLTDRSYRGHVWQLTDNSLWPLSGIEEQCAKAGAFTRDGGRLVLNTGPNEVGVWHLDAGTYAPFRARHDRSIVDVALAPDERHFATASEDPGVRIWQLADGRPTSPLLPHADFVRRVAFSPDGRWLLSASLDGHVRMWTVPDGRPWQKPLVHPDPVDRIFFSPRSRLVATATINGEVRVWRLADGAPVTPAFAHAGWVRQVEFDAGEDLIRTVTTEGVQRIWDLAGDAPVTLPTPLDTGTDLPWPAREQGSPLTDLDALERQAALLSGNRVGPDGDVERLNAEEWENLWRRHQAGR